MPDRTRPPGRVGTELGYLRDALGELATQFERLCLASTPPSRTLATIPDELIKAMAKDAREVELPGPCVALLSWGHQLNPGVVQDVWDAVRAIVAEQERAGWPAILTDALPVMKPLPDGLRGVVTGNGAITVCARSPRQSQKYAKREALRAAERLGWLPTPARAVLGAALAVRKHALRILVPVGTVGTAAALTLTFAHAPSVWRPLQNGTPAPTPAAMIPPPHHHRRRIRTVRADLRPSPSSVPVPSGAASRDPDGSLVLVPLPPLKIPVPLPSLVVPQPAPTCVPAIATRACVPLAAVPVSR